MSVGYQSRKSEPSRLRWRRGGRAGTQISKLVAAPLVSEMQTRCDAVHLQDAPQIYQSMSHFLTTLCSTIHLEETPQHHAIQPLQPLAAKEKSGRAEGANVSGKRTSACRRLAVIEQEYRSKKLTCSV